MSSDPAKPTQNQPKRDLYTPQPVQTRVIARHMNGESNRKIAAEEGIDRATVGRILSQEELTRVIAEQQLALVHLGWSAIAVYQAALDSDDLEIAVPTATKLLEGTRLLHKEGFQITLLNTVDWVERNDKKRALEATLGAVARDEPPPKMPPTSAYKPCPTIAPRRKAALSQTSSSASGLLKRPTFQDRPGKDDPFRP